MNYTLTRILFYLLAGILLSSCSKDLGNYEYTEINEVSTTGIEEIYKIRYGVDTLRISPQLLSSQDIQDPDRYDYFWTARDHLVSLDTIGRTLDLNYRVQLKPGVYQLMLSIVDKETKILWRKTTRLEIGSTLSRGIMLIGEDDQQNVDVDMIVMNADTTIARGLISGSGLPPLRGPLNISYVSSWRDADNKLWLFTESGSYFLNRVTFEGSTADIFDKLVFTRHQISSSDLQPVAIAPTFHNVAGTQPDLLGWARVTVTKGGHIFGPNVAENNGDFYGDPVSRTADAPDVLLKAAPYLFYSPRSTSSMIWYDQNNEKFMYIPSYTFNYTSRHLNDTPQDPFPWDQAGTGRKLVYGENTTNSSGGAIFGNSYALMKDAQSRFYIYRFYTNGANPLKTGFFPIQAIATGIERATHFAFSSTRSVMLYVVDGQLFAYDYNPGNERAYSLAVSGPDPITMIKFDLQINPNVNSLYIGTYNTTTKGTLQRFVLGTDPNTFEITPVLNEKWTDLVKIKNMAWRPKN